MTLYKDFYKGKRILVTGHTGFKGTWMCLYLHELGAEVIGVSLDPKSDEELFVRANISDLITDNRLDLRNKNELQRLIDKYNPEIVFHLAAQPLVFESYKDPYYTWDVNLMGTLNLIDILRDSKFVKAVIIITTDKVYKNTENINGYKEDDALGGFDPYSASKAAVEILVESYKNSYYLMRKIGIATARSGNVIGGGDWGNNRLIPDIFKAYLTNEDFILRNPDSVRPWQHVLDVVHGYMLLGMMLRNDYTKFSTSWNFGPNKSTLITTKELINRINHGLDVNIKLKIEEHQKHETKILTLDSNKSKDFLGWENNLDINKSIEFTKNIYLVKNEIGLRDKLLEQIRDYLNNFQ